MNAVATEVSAPLTIDAAMAQVRAAVAHLRAVEAEHLSDQAALARGRDRLHQAASEVERINTANADAIARHAKRLEQQAREGSTAALPQLTPTDQHLVRELVAQRTHAAAVAMVASLQSTVDASAARVLVAHRAVESALATLRQVEIHDRIHNGLILLDEFEATYAEIAVRTEGIHGDSKFGNEIDDPEPSHMRMRSVWDCLQRQRMGPTSQRGVLEPQPPLVKARAALAARDAQLTNPTSEQT